MNDKTSFGEWPPVNSKQENQEKDFEKIKEEFFKWVDSHLDEIYNLKYYPHLEYETPVELWIAKKLNLKIEEESFLNQNNEQVQSLVKIFLNKLLGFSISLLDKISDEEQEKRERFIYNLDDLYVDQEPDLTSFLPIEEQIIFAGKSNKLNFLANDFGEDINLRLINTWEEFLKNKEKIKETISILPLNEKIEVLENLVKISLEYEYTTYGNDIWEKEEILAYELTSLSNEVKNILEKVLDEDGSVLANIFKEKFVERIDKKGLVEVVPEMFYAENEDEFLPTGSYGDAISISSDFAGIYELNIIPSYLVKKENKEIDSYKKIEENSFVDFEPEYIRFLHRPDILLPLSDEIGINLRKISLQDQIHFMQFLAGENQETFDRLKKLFENSEIENENLLKSFLSTAGDLSFGKNILEIAETKSVEKVNEIFVKYVEIVEKINYIEEILYKELKYYGGDDRSELARKIAEDLLKKGKYLLKRAAELDEEEIVLVLENIKVEIEIFKSVFKKRYENNKKNNRSDKNNLEEFSRIKLDIVKGLELKDEEIEKMKEIYSQNYPDEEGFKDNFRAALLESLSQKINSENSEFNLVKKDGEMIGFNSFTDVSDDEIIFANFNMDKKFSSSKIGSALLDETLLKKAKDKIVLAVALKDSEILKHYIENLGFEIIEDGLDFAGKEIVKIKLDKRKM